MNRSKGAAERNELTYEVIVKALFEAYESVYDIDAETFAYARYHESEAYHGLQLARSGKDFFTAMIAYVNEYIHPEDRAYVIERLSPQTLFSELKKAKTYTFVYRLIMDDKPIYHQIRATMANVGGRPHILFGVRNIDTVMRLEQEHVEAIASMRQKERNHLEAVLGSAAAYLEVNLTRDLVLERSPSITAEGNFAGITLPFAKGEVAYTPFMEWVIHNMVTENVRKFAEISDRQYLMDCFERGEKRVSVLFRTRRHNGEKQPCRQVFYLYRDSTSGDVMSFCVVYDLSEQQKRERELQMLGLELRLSRIRNFTGQMQPHFLYNALGSIQEIVLDDPVYASELLGDFTTHLRSCIRAMENDAPIPFEQELKNIEAYVNIERMRLGSKLNVRYDIKTTEFSVLPLSVQPLVENAIRHGIYQRGQTGGTVTVSTGETKNTWIVCVEDDGIGFDVDAYRKKTEAGATESAGLKNLIFRLKNMLHADVDLKSRIGEGTKVTVTIPKGGNTV